MFLWCGYHRALVYTQCHVQAVLTPCSPSFEIGKAPAFEGISSGAITISSICLLLCCCGPSQHAPAASFKPRQVSGWPAAAD